MWKSFNKLVHDFKKIQVNDLRLDLGQKRTDLPISDFECLLLDKDKQESCPITFPEVIRITF
jgi:hypothetical protein